MHNEHDHLTLPSARPELPELRNYLINYSAQLYSFSQQIYRCHMMGMGMKLVDRLTVEVADEPELRRLNTITKKLEAIYDHLNTTHSLQRISKEWAALDQIYEQELSPQKMQLNKYPWHTPAIRLDITVPQQKRTPREQLLINGVRDAAAMQHTCRRYAGVLAAWEQHQDAALSDADQKAYDREWKRYHQIKDGIQELMTKERQMHSVGVLLSDVSGDGRISQEGATKIVSNASRHWNMLQYQSLQRSEQMRYPQSYREAEELSAEITEQIDLFKTTFESFRKHQKTLEEEYKSRPGNARRLNMESLKRELDKLDALFNPGKNMGLSR